jgi:hypothetical protein
MLSAIALNALLSAPISSLDEIWTRRVKSPDSSRLAAAVNSSTGRTIRRDSQNAAARAITATATAATVICRLIAEMVCLRSAA